MCEVYNKPGPTKLHEMKKLALLYYERAARKTENFHNCNPTKLSVGLHLAIYTNECEKDTLKSISIAEMVMNKALA